MAQFPAECLASQRWCVAEALGFRALYPQIDLKPARMPSSACKGVERVCSACAIALVRGSLTQDQFRCSCRWATRRLAKWHRPSPACPRSHLPDSDEDRRVQPGAIASRMDPSLPTRLMSRFGCLPASAGLSAQARPASMPAPRARWTHHLPRLMFRAIPSC